MSLAVRVDNDDDSESWNSISKQYGLLMASVPVNLVTVTSDGGKSVIEIRNFAEFALALGIFISVRGKIIFRY